MDRSIIGFRGKSHFEDFLQDNPELGVLGFEGQLNYFRKFGVNTQTSCFFREGGALRFLNNEVISRFPSDYKIKIASVGCSSGEDIYSVLLSNWNRRDSLVLHGYEINPDMIENARRGVYAYGRGLFEDRFRMHCNESARDAYDLLNCDGTQKIQMKSDACERISFFEHDILRSPLLEKYDVVLLENVLMHYTSRGRNRILRHVNKSLNDDGFLLCEATSSFGPPEWEIYQRWMTFIDHTGFKQVGNPFLQLYQKHVPYCTFPKNIGFRAVKGLAELIEKVDHRVNPWKYE